MHRHAGVPYRFLPAEGGRGENWRFLLRVEGLKRRLLTLTWPVLTAEDEFPLVPYVFGPDGENLYDSSAVGEWLDRGLPPRRRLVPADSAAAFVVRLIDDFADEFGLYLVHHNRWKVSARCNNAGERLAREFQFLFPAPLRPLQARWFAARQTRRLPYLFSVAPPGFRIEGLAPARQPPSRDGFPATHELLEGAFQRLLAILEERLSLQPFVLGPRFTLADASLYGQLGMNLSDPAADQWMQRSAPGLRGWLLAQHDGTAHALASGTAIALDEGLRPLLAEICRTYVPLMRQNAAAYEAFRVAGAWRFNEDAFGQGQQLYAGEIDGHPFRAVAKSFQARVWRESVMRWQGLDGKSRALVTALLPASHGLDGVGQP